MSVGFLVQSVRTIKPPRLLTDSLRTSFEGGSPPGEWQDGPLPSPSQLRQEYGGGRIIVVRALELLLDEGVVYRVPKQGVYVTQD